MFDLILCWCRGLEKALDQIEAERNALVGAEAAAMARAAGVPVRLFHRAYTLCVTNKSSPGLSCPMHPQP